MASVRTGYYYLCPDVQAVDAHLRVLLRDYLGPRSNMTAASQAQSREDVDLLLSRRWFLEMTA